MDSDRDMEYTNRLFADDCEIYRKIINNDDMKKTAEIPEQAKGMGG